MSEVIDSQLDFVYAVHEDEYGTEVGNALLGGTVTPEVIALEWSRISITKPRVKRVLPLVYEDFRRITDPESTPEQVNAHIANMGSVFYRSLLRPLVGSGVKITLIDVFDDPYFGDESKDFNEGEMMQRLSVVIADDSLSLEKRKRELVSIAQKEAYFIQRREHVVLEQLGELCNSHSRISIFQGLGHQAVADLFSTPGITATKTFVPILEPWPGGNPVTDDDYVPQLYKLSRMMNLFTDVDEIPEIVVEKALLAEFIYAYITRSTVLRKEAVNVFGEVVAASRVVEGLSEERIRSKLRAAVRVCTKGGSMTPVLKPLMPKHSIRSFTPPDVA